MILTVIRTLASSHTAEELSKAAASYETERHNPLNVEGKDEAEILTNLLMATTVREKMEKQGLSLQDAIREHSRSVQKILSGSKIKP